MKKLFLAFLLLCFAGALTILSKNPTFIAFLTTHTEVKTTTTTTNKAPAISATANGFSPSSITIKPGEKATWTNTSGTIVNISSTTPPANSDYPPLNLGNFANKSTVSLTFDKPGTYKYYNNINPLQHGEIIVQ